MNIYQNIILDYINHGFSPIPVPFKTKRPIIKEWPKLKLSPNNCASYFDGTPTNIAILTGTPSGGLVDVDIDDIAALKFASWFLPKTNCVFGRTSKPKSHWLYRVPDVEDLHCFTANSMILEIRGNGRATIFPGSVHPNGEAIEFENPDDYAPSSSTWRELTRAGSKIAIATAIHRTWGPGIRHQLTLYTAATLARLGWRITEVRDLITAIVDEANDDEIEDRLSAIETTFTEYAQGKPISGNDNLIRLLGAETVENIRKWACSPEASKPQALAPVLTNSISSTLADLSNNSGAADAFSALASQDVVEIERSAGYAERIITRSIDRAGRG